MGGTMVQSLVLPNLCQNRAQFRQLKKTCAVARVTISNLQVDPSSLRFSGIQTFSPGSGSIIRRQAMRPICKQTRSVAVRAMLELFNDKAIKVVMLSLEEASRMGCYYVGTVHLLLVLISEGTGITVKVLNSVGINIMKVRNFVDRGSGSLGFASSDIRFNRDAKQVVELSLEKAHQLGHDYVGPEHLLLGLLQVHGAATNVLERFGVHHSKIHAQVTRMVGENTEVVGEGTGSRSIEQKMQNYDKYGTEELADKIELMLIGCVTYFLQYCRCR